MKKPTIADKMHDHSAAMREEIAKRVLDIKTIYQAIQDAATAGMGDVRIIQVETVDLSQTTYAKGLAKRLRKDGFGYHWQNAARKEYFRNDETGQTLETGHIFRFKELYISWEGLPDTIQRMQIAAE